MLTTNYLRYSIIDNGALAPWSFLQSNNMNNNEITFHKNSDRSNIALALGFLTEEQMMELAQITPSTLEKWRKTGRGPVHTRLGNAVFYPLVAVREYLESEVRQDGGVCMRKIIAAA